MNTLKKISIFLLPIFLLGFVLSTAISRAAAADTLQEVEKTMSLCADPFATWNFIITGNLSKVSEGLGAIECLIGGIISFLLELAWIIAAIYVAIAGIKYQMSAGNSTARTNALKSLNSALIGFALILLVFALLRFFLAFIEFQAFVDATNFAPPAPPAP